MATVVVEPPARAKKRTILSPPIVVHSYMSTTDAARALYSHAVAQAYLIDPCGTGQPYLLRGRCVTSASHMADDFGAAGQGSSPAAAGGVETETGTVATTSSAASSSAAATRDSAYFIFPDLSVTLTGCFAISIHIYDLNHPGPQNTLVEEVTTRVFTIVSGDTPEEPPCE